MKPGRTAFWLAAATATAAAAAFIAGIWTQDSRWAATGAVLAGTALILVITGSARAAAAEKETGHRKITARPMTNIPTPPIRPTTERPRPPRRPRGSE